MHRRGRCNRKAMPPFIASITSKNSFLITSSFIMSTNKSTLSQYCESKPGPFLEVFCQLVLCWAGYTTSFIEMQHWKLVFT